ncbi:uncharacterized protein LOC111342382 [Stylophora pistillata]|uniref:uncharacterized protein LOC111342382 n=1 Tax=Stylophora pistillata TaxID=50429 RepID=UPI000C041771|nr:uncharacterized protein LOC111342382 [Stylophora pistillata]
MAVFVVIFFSFCGALTLSLCYSASRENQELRGFGDVLLSGFRALSEQYPMVEDYSTFNWLSVLLMMAYMGTVTVILLNILIAQMSTTYTQAKKVARLEYDVDRILQITRMERLPFQNLRMKYYKEGEWISEMKLAKELLEFSEDRNPWESVEGKLLEIRRVEEDFVVKDISNKEDSQTTTDCHHEDFLSSQYDREFWNKVTQKQSNGVLWNRAMDEVLLERLIQKYKANGGLDREDPALLMLKIWPASKQYKDSPEKLPGLEQLISLLLEILLRGELNLGNRYETFRDVNKTKRTLLCYAAELGFLKVAKTLVKKCPLLLSMETKQPWTTKPMFPVEMALLAEKDEVVAYLIRMMWYESFKFVFENPKMKKTTLALLDQMVNPHRPHLPKRKDSYKNEHEKEGIEGAWRTITDDPIDYHFYYHILDGDEGGRPPELNTTPGKEKQTDNNHFTWRDRSCLHVIAKSKNKEALQHPVVRMLVKTKWKSYGHFFLRYTLCMFMHRKSQG